MTATPHNESSCKAASFLPFASLGLIKKSSGNDSLFKSGRHLVTGGGLGFPSVKEERPQGEHAET